MTSSGRSWRVRAAIAVLAVVGAAFAAAGLAPPAAADEPCVGVVVDATRAGGTVQARCARTDPRSGFAALQAAGFSFRLRPDGLVCQIGGRPDECAASTQRYWSYWYRAAGSTGWTYSSLGPGARDPKPGSTEGWVFQTGGGQSPPPNISQATICPPAAAPKVARKTSPSAAATSRAPTKPRARSQPRRSSPARQASASGASGTTARPPSARASNAVAPTAAATSVASSPASPTRFPASAAARAADASGGVTNAALAGDDGRRPTGLLVGGALILAIAVAIAARIYGSRPSRR